LRELSAADRRAQHWQARLVAQSEDGDGSRARCDGLQAFIGEFLKDAGIRLVSTMAHLESAVRVQFRPALGQVPDPDRGPFRPGLTSPAPRRPRPAAARNFVATPPCAEKPPALPPAASTDDRAR